MHGYSIPVGFFLDFCFPDATIIGSVSALVAGAAGLDSSKGLSTS